MNDNSLQTAIISADPRLSRYNPLGRIVMYDDFDHGLSGWTELISASDYPDPNGTMFQLPRWNRDYRPPMLSTLTMPDIGTHGAMQGTYALKVATRPRTGHFAKSLKRITWLRKGIYQAECYFTFKPEPASLKLAEESLRYVGVSFDIQDEEHRYFMLVRYLNALDGKLQHKWQYSARSVMLPSDGGYAEGGWEDIPGGDMDLCYNETITKVNWHYLRWVIDLEKREHVELQCNDRTFDIRGLTPAMRPPTDVLRGLLNLGFYVETGADVRSFFYIDSVLLSTHR